MSATSFDIAPDPRPVVLLLAGRIGSGKSTLAQTLQKHKGFQEVALADPLKEACAQLFEFPVTWCYSREGKEQCPPLGGGLRVGQLLQRLGTEVGRNLNDRLWIQKASALIQAMDYKRVVISDCRFPNEAATFLHDPTYCAHLIHLTRAPLYFVGSRDSHHPSEGMGWIEGFRSHPCFHELDNAAWSLPYTEGELLRLTSQILGDPLTPPHEEEKEIQAPDRTGQSAVGADTPAPVLQ